MHPQLFALFTLAAGMPWALALTMALLFGTFIHFGSFDASAAIDILQSQGVAQTVALTPSTIIPAGLITGALDVILINTAANPLNQTTRTAAQLFADITAALGFPPPANFQYFLRIVHQGAGTLTLVAGAGVSLGTGTTTVLTTANRDYLVTVVNPGSVVIQTTGSGSA